MSAAKGPRWSETTDTEQVEQRTYQTHGLTSEMGRSSVLAVCPFCSATVKAYLWSLAGGGKRCGCGALLGSSGNAYQWRWIVELDAVSIT